MRVTVTVRIRVRIRVRGFTTITVGHRIQDQIQVGIRIKAF